MKLGTKDKIVEVANNFKAQAIIATTTLAIQPTNVMAGGLDGAAGNDIWTAIMNLLATWSGRIGLAVTFFGAIQVAFGFKSDDADGKQKGLKTAASGIIVFAISKSVDYFLSIS